MALDSEASPEAVLAFTRERHLTTLTTGAPTAAPTPPPCGALGDTPERVVLLLGVDRVLGRG